MALAMPLIERQGRSTGLALMQVNSGNLREGDAGVRRACSARFAQPSPATAPAISSEALPMGTSSGRQWHFCGEGTRKGATGILLKWGAVQR
ncbi:hypothetical protein D9599_19255 [Roseomonas sp. KE2513]|uniref:hypothetical protein n=1 Tax=Roseomonas sp. KE2513 TaxID=2479202 RepID=UPI0018DEF3C9|nr:hypothetical protein [Roseomonas sp. KE2513]MBI0537702.1 hypothetical protein [Roseomonas sp. KE2513]